jgi:hypothetical protein
MLLSIFITAMLLIVFAPSLRAQMGDIPSATEENVQEPSTDKFFPKEVAFTYDGKDYTLSVTGLGVRKKFIFKVYGIAHYMEAPEMEKNATDEEMQEIQPFVDQFVGFFNSEVKENELYILRWLPGGTVLTMVKGEEKPAITNSIFARVLWAIWMGKDSIVDRDKLVKMMVSR